MSYNKLHEGLACNCLEQAGVTDNVDGDFVRSIPKRFLSMDHMMSYYEQRRTPRTPIDSDKVRCKWRCLSSNKLDNNRVQIKEHYQSIKAAAPMGFEFEYVCIFRLRTGTAKVWPTPNGRQPSHHSLLKSDDFDLSSLDIDEIVPFEDF
jgi:hypothetical protein